MYAQAGLSLCWSHIPHCWKSHVMAHMMLVNYKMDVRVANCDEPNDDQTASSEAV